MLTIGILKWLDFRLKPKRGKRLALRVLSSDGYQQILEKAIEKWKIYCPECFDENDMYTLCYENGNDCILMPGDKDRFDLRRYHLESGKDYKRIVLYLCAGMEKDAYINSAKGIPKSSSDSDPEDWNITSSPQRKSQRVSNCIDSDQVLARQLQESFDSEYLQPETDHSLPCSSSYSSSIPISAENRPKTSATVPQASKTSSIEEIIKELQEKVDTETTFDLFIRRGACLPRNISLFQRGCKKNSPTQQLRIKYVGESGIDTGALRKEFLEIIISDLKQTVFKEGKPMDSMMYVHDGTFHAAGQLAAVSLCQGGPAPTFFQRSVFDMLLSLGETSNYFPELTTDETKLMAQIKEDPSKYADFIIENGYTGSITPNNVADIIGTITVSICTRRKRYLEDFKDGLQSYNIFSYLCEYKEQMRTLFLSENDKINEVSADFIFGSLSPMYSDKGSSNRVLEMKCVDNFQDFLNDLEDNDMKNTREEQLAYNESNEDEDIEEGNRQVSLAKLTPSGILGWLTGQRHKNLDGEEMIIVLQFDHGCIKRNPHHTICYPIVQACSKTITLPVVHMVNKETFFEIFQTAYCKSQTFFEANNPVF